MDFQSILIGEFIPKQYDNYLWIFNESKKVDFKLTTVVFFYLKYAHSNNLEWAKYTKQINSDLIFWLTWHWGANSSLTMQKCLYNVLGLAGIVYIRSNQWAFNSRGHLKMTIKIRCCCWVKRSVCHAYPGINSGVFSCTHPQIS